MHIFRFLPPSRDFFIHSFLMSLSIYLIDRKRDLVAHNPLVLTLGGFIITHDQIDLGQPAPVALFLVHRPEETVVVQHQGVIVLLPAALNAVIRHLLRVIDHPKSAVLFGKESSTIGLEHNEYRVNFIYISVYGKRNTYQSHPPVAGVFEIENRVAAGVPVAAALGLIGHLHPDVLEVWRFVGGHDLHIVVFVGLGVGDGPHEAGRSETRGRG